MGPARSRGPEPLWQEVLRRAAVTLGGRAVGVWEADARGRLHLLASSSEGPRPSRRRAGGGAAHAGRVARSAPAAMSLGREPSRGTALVHRAGPPRAAPTAARCRAARARTGGTRAGGRVYRVARRPRPPGGGRA